ncbi:MAG: glycosyltransferase, partial [Verrucomicrobiota bacterium]|nr:glycosyltransferase [Verrucomicrobiota bacterium]
LYDPFSNACLEALASGLPVITTSTNGFSETIDEGVHGSVIDDAADVEALACAIDAWSDLGRRAQARPLILERGAQFDISKNVACTLEILLQEAAASAASASGKIRKT